MLLSASQLEYLQLNIEASRRSLSRADLHLWLRGAFQALLPHRMLLAALGVAGRPVPIVETFTSEPLGAALRAELTAADGILAAAMAEWRRAGNGPWRVRAGEAGVAARLERCGIVQAVGDGIRDPAGHALAFFLFADAEQSDRDPAALFMSLVVPLLYVAFSRVLGAEVGRGSVARPARAILSERELDVLRLIQTGCINDEIARRLGISALTVKNHVQGILRKLNAQNRAQAVAAAIASGVLG